MHAALPLLAVWLMLLPAGQAFAQAPERLSREQALAALVASAREQRLQGAVRLAEVGLMSDVPVLLGSLRDPDETVRSIAENSIWTIWSHSGDARIDELYKKGVALMEESRTDEAIELFSRIIHDRPGFAEGWNKRATLYFLAGEYRKSLKDCAEVIKRNPYHFGALSGQGQIYLELEEYEKALDYFRRALNVNPNLEKVERSIEVLERVIEERRRRMI